MLNVYLLALVVLPFCCPMPYRYAKGRSVGGGGARAPLGPSPSLMAHPVAPSRDLPPWEKEGAAADPDRYRDAAAQPPQSGPLALVAIFGTLAAAAALPFALWGGGGGGGGGWERSQEASKMQQRVEDAVRAMRDL